MKYKHQLVLLSCLIVTACTTQETGSKDTYFQKQLVEAERALHSLDFSRAETIYQELLTIDPETLSYAQGRRNVVERRLNETNLLSEQITGDIQNELSEKELEQLMAWNEALSRLKNEAHSLQVAQASPNVSELTALYREIDELRKEAAELPTASLLKGVEDVKKTVHSHVQTALIDPLTKDIKAAMAEDRLQDAHASLQQLQDVEKAFPELARAAYETQWTDFAMYRASFLLEPGTFTKQQQTIFENSQLGQVDFLGVGQTADQPLLYFSIEGPMARWADKLPIKAEARLQNGSSVVSTEWTTYHTDTNKSLATATLKGINNTDDIQQLDWSWPISDASLEPVALISGANDAKSPVVHRMETGKHDLNAQLNNEAYSIRFHSYQADGQTLTISGTIDAKQHLNETKTIYVHLAGTDLFTQKSLPLSVAAGTSTGFSVSFPFDKNLSEHHKLLKWTIDDISTTLSLKEGRFVSLPEEPLVDQPWLSRTPYQKIDGLDEKQGRFLTDVNGTVWGNAIAVSTNTPETIPTFDVIASPNQRVWKGQVIVDETTAGKGYGTSLVTFTINGEIVRQIKLDDLIQSGQFNVPLTNEHQIRVTVEQENGTQGYQQILFTDSLLTENTTGEEG
ncbi:hypothetical protein G4V62_05515 [Bacillaceae bacterium SIJ1]|uniref:hypothetical protein n=1 Tax=Litoribacterium kuwaitense TaxID=1398745 RepID=UPI0013EC1EE2|nr:hypothetical protein [Litoribacterium kuwaitense]NGP44439.1 hypothetical protein [Litoribacterium kuwaitense]